LGSSYTLKNLDRFICIIIDLQSVTFMGVSISALVSRHDTTSKRCKYIKARDVCTIIFDASYITRNAQVQANVWNYIEI